MSFFFFFSYDRQFLNDINNKKKDILRFVK